MSKPLLRFTQKTLKNVLTNFKKVYWGIKKFDGRKFDLESDSHKELLIHLN